MSKARRYFALVAIALAVSMHASIALAAPAGWKSVDVTLQSEQQQSMLLVSGELPAEVELPAEAELAVPAGTQLQWIGQTLGGDPSQDPELKYEKSTSAGMDIYRFTLTKARTAQVEGIVPNATTFDGTNYLTGLKWTAWQSVPEVRISQRIPQGSQIVQAAPGAAIQPGGTGYSYYTKTVKDPKAGEALDLSFSYSLPAAGATSASNGGGSNSDSVILVIIIAVLAGGFGLLILNVRKKMAVKTVAEAVTVKPARPAVQATNATSSTSRRKKSGSQPPVVAAPPKKAKPVIPMLVVVGVIVVGFIIAGGKGTSAAVADDKISRNFGAPSACQNASVPFTANQGVDLAKQGDKLLKGLEGMEGVGVVTVDLAQSKIDMAWCESSQTEDTMRQAMSKSGLITLGEGTSTAASSSATATLDAAGTTQVTNVDTSSGNFSPSQIVLKAGVPAEISFGEEVGCLSEVVISDLGINQDLSSGRTTVKLPALEAGTYGFACAMGHKTGQIVVQ